MREKIQDKDKTKGQLIEELAKLRCDMAKLGVVEKRYTQIEKTIEETQINIQGILSSMVDLVFAFDAQGRFVFYHAPRHEDLYVKPGKFIGKKHNEVMPVHLHKLFEMAFRQNKKGKVAEFQYVLKMGRKDKWFFTKLSPICLEGKFMGSVAVVRDITDYKQAEHKLKESEQNYRTTINAMADAVHVVDKDLRIIIFNDTFQNWCKTLGLETEAIGRKLFDIFPFLPSKVRGEYRQVFNTGRVIVSEEKNKINDKEIITETRKIPIFEGHKVVGVVTVIRNMTELKQIEEKLRDNLNNTQKLMRDIIQAMALTVEKRDPHIAEHQMRTARLTAAITREMGFSKDDIAAISWAALIHDLGKIHIPMQILSKPSQLSKAEFEIIKTHPQISYDILKTIEFPWKIAKIVSQHHERLDGSGYPYGLSGKEILMEARILAVADVVEAMSSARPYRAAIGIDEALKEISKNKGILYDAKVVNVCVRLFKKKNFEFN